MVANRTFTSPFLDASYKAVMQWMELEWKNYWPDPDESLLIASVGNLQDLRKAQDATREIRFPYAFFAFAKVEPYLEKGALARRYNQEYIRLPKAGKAIVRTCIPVKLGFMLQFKTNNINHILAFAQMMINNLPGPTFYFEDENGFRVECKANFDPTFDIPQADSAGIGDTYSFEIPAFVSSYTGITFEQGLIKRVILRYAVASGSRLDPVLLDIENGRVSNFGKYEIDYKDIYDKTSPHWKGRQ